MNIRLCYILLGIVLWGCGSEPPPPKTTGSPYFSLSDYFSAEIAALDSLQPLVKKTVWKNRQDEQRTLTELDWASELDIFKSSDINKPAWRSSYSVDSVNENLIYRAMEDDLRVRTVRIHRNPRGKVQEIIIERAKKNYLYSSSELLKYYPDSLYSIERKQKVQVLGSDRFHVSGRF